MESLVNDGFSLYKFQFHKELKIHMLDLKLKLNYNIFQKQNRER